MQRTSGELTDKGILVKKPKEVGRLFTKSHFGTTLSGNSLLLNLIEGIYLLTEEKLRVFQNEREIGFEELVSLAIKKIDRFETLYLMFRDLRRRGYAVQLTTAYPPFDFHIHKKDPEEENDPSLCLISAFSERDIIDITTIHHLTLEASKHDSALWFGIVDEEGDVTYYDVSPCDLQGEMKPQKFVKSKGLLLENRVIIFDETAAKNLLSKEFFGKPFGTGLQLSLVEARYLMERNLLEILSKKTEKPMTHDTVKDMMKKAQPDIEDRLSVFTDLKQRGLIVKTGFKFGAHFRAYTNKPEKTHADYLIHVLTPDFSAMWAEISRAVRLAHSVNKEIAFALVETARISYIKFGRLRP
jgi:tRNA-intron endonuclease